MTFEQIITDIGAGIAAVAAVATILAHLPFLPAKYAEFFARLALYASNEKFSVNQRDTLPKPPVALPPQEFEQTPPTKPWGGPSAGGFALLLAMGLGLHAQGCSLFGSKSSVWPALGACVPPTDTLFSEVESVLTSSGGNYEDDLLALGKTEGLEFVECAVKSVVEALSARIAARKVTPGARITPDEGIGVARGKAFLAKIEEAHK